MAVKFEEFPEKLLCIAQSDKRTDGWKIKKAANGFAFFDIEPERGHLADELKGMYTSIEAAKKAIEQHERNLRLSQATKNHILQEEREKRHAAKSGSQTRQHIREGSDNGAE